MISERKKLNQGNLKDVLTFGYFLYFGFHGFEHHIELSLKLGSSMYHLFKKSNDDNLK